MHECENGYHPFGHVKFGASGYSYMCAELPRVIMSRETQCLRCSTTFDYDDGECPSCGWNASEFRERGRYGLSRPNHGEPESAD